MVLLFPTVAPGLSSQCRIRCSGVRARTSFSATFIQWHGPSHKLMFLATASAMARSSTRAGRHSERTRGSGGNARTRRCETNYIHGPAPTTRQMRHRATRSGHGRAVQPFQSMVQGSSLNAKQSEPQRLGMYPGPPRAADIIPVALAPVHIPAPPI